MKILFTLCMVMTVSAAFAQPDTLWTRTYGGPYSDYCYSARVTDDQGFILAGYTSYESFGPEDFYLVKTDSVGELQWEQTYGGPALDVCWQIRPVPTGGYILSGSTQSYGAGAQDGWLVRVNENGDSLWSQTYGGAGWDEIFSVSPTSDGGFILGGYSGSFGPGAFDFWLIKTDEAGATQWSRTYGYSTEGEFATSALETADGGFLISGWAGSPSSNQQEFWLLRTDADGDSLWSVRPAIGYCYAMRETSDNGIVLIGIEIVHRADDRSVFAKGTLRAAEWLVDRSPGFYSMADVLGI